MRAQSANGSGGNRFPDRMQETRLPLVSDPACERAYKGDFTVVLMVYAGKKAVDACQGDSGGPVWAATNAGRRQIDITSFGYGCATASYPGVYTEVNAPRIRSLIRQADSWRPEVWNHGPSIVS